MDNTSEKETGEMVSLRNTPAKPDVSVNTPTLASETGAANKNQGTAGERAAVVKAEARRLRRYLRLYFHPAFKLNGNKCTIHVFYCLLFLVQIVKLSVITVQMFKFGRDRGHFSSIVNRGQTTLRHLLVEGWDASWETLPYPPAHGEFAVYDVQDVTNKINYAVERFLVRRQHKRDAIPFIKKKQVKSLTADGLNYINRTYALLMPYYYNVENIAIGFYTMMSGDKMYIVMQWFDFIDCGNCSKRNSRLELSEITFPIDKGLSSHIDNTTNNTVYKYDVMKEFAYQNLSMPIKKLLLLTLKFSIHSVRIFEHDNEALCLSIIGELSFSDQDNNGQVIVQLNTVSSKVMCSQLELDIKDWSLQRASMGLAKAVIAICSIGLIITLIVLAFAIFVFAQTKLFMRKYYQVCYQPEDPEETDLPAKEYFRFILLWDLCATVADCLTLYGTIRIIFKSERRKIDLNELDVFTIWLAVGCFFAWFNILRFVKFYKKFRLLFNTVYRAFSDVLAYLVCVAVLYTGFFVVGYVVLGPYNIKFSTPSKASETLSALVNGDEIYATFGIMETEDSSSIWWFSRAYLWTYIAVFTIIILNLLVAIFMSAYEAVKDTYEKKEEDRGLGPVEKALREFLDNPKKTSFRASLCDLMSSSDRYGSVEEQALRRQLSKMCRLSATGDDVILIRSRTLKAFMEEEHDAKEFTCFYVVFSFIMFFQNDRNI